MTKVVPVVPAKVANSELAASIKFKKPVPTVPEPLTAFAPQFLKRLIEMEEKTHTVTLSSQRQMCYFDESGAGESLPVLLCIHGVGQSKELWLEPEPVPNVRLIAIDRMGHGSSSPMPRKYEYDDVVAEIGELLGKIGVQNFFVVGHSAGASCALQVAAGLGGGDNGRVLGCAAISGVCDKYHATAPKAGSKGWKKLCVNATIETGLGPNAGCCGGRFARALMNMAGKSCVAEKKDEDFGFHELYMQSERKGDGGCERTWEAMDKDPFFVSKNIYAVLHGCNNTGTMLTDLLTLNGEWHHDCSNFKGHCVVYNGENDTTPVTNAEQHHRAIPQSDLVIMKGHGHTTIMMEAPTIIQALIAGKSAEQVY